MKSSRNRSGGDSIIVLGPVLRYHLGCKVQQNIAVYMLLLGTKSTHVLGVIVVLIKHPMYSWYEMVLWLKALVWNPKTYNVQKQHVTEMWLSF